MLRITITKSTADMSLGFRLEKNAEGKIYIAKISKDSVLDGTVVREGMIVCLVNGINCEGQSLSFVSSIIRDAEGTVQLGIRDPKHKNGVGRPPLIDWDDQTADSGSVRDSVASGRGGSSIDDDETSTLVCVSRVKHLQDKIGLRLRVSPRENNIRIHEIVPNGVFAETALRPDMILLRVNGMDVNGWPVSDVLDIIKHTDGTLTLEAEKIGKNPNKFSVCMQKVGEMGKVVTNQVAKLNKKQWGVILRTGFVVLLEMNGIDSGFVTGDN